MSLPGSSAQHAGKRIFIHINAFKNRNRRPETNQIVAYAVSTDRQGRPCAVQATLAGDRLVEDKNRNSVSLPVIGAAIFLVLVVISVLASKIPAVILAIYVVASLVTYVAYAVDKSAAKKGSWRTQESTLHLLSLIGGWPGAVVAQQTLRHKSKKESFRVAFWVTVILNCGIFVWLLMPSSSATVQSLILNLT